MFLGIDIGNTTILLGVYEGRRLLLYNRIETKKDKGALFYGQEILRVLSPILKERIRSTLISSVVPPLNEVFREVIMDYIGIRPQFIDPLTVGMPLKITYPAELGADRIVNAIAAYELYGGPVVVIDFGTATTYDVISKDGEYLGGLIAPGIEVSAKAMWEKAELLYEVEITKPSKVIGQETRTSMQSGIFYGAIGQMEGILSRIRCELGLAFKVVVTGGLSMLVAQGSELIDETNPILTLEGLRIISSRIK